MAVAPWVFGRNHRFSTIRWQNCEREEILSRTPGIPTPGWYTENPVHFCQIRWQVAVISRDSKSVIGNRSTIGVEYLSIF